MNQPNLPAGAKQVKLTQEEIERAAMLGVRRNAEAAVRNSKARWGGLSTCWNGHIQGSLAEMAFAKWMNCYWEGHTSTYTQKADVAGCEVRWSSNNKLKRKDSDALDQKYILVIGEAPVMTICGWIWGHEFQKLGVFEDPGQRGKPAWFVDAIKLRPLSDLN